MVSTTKWPTPVVVKLPLFFWEGGGIFLVKILGYKIIEQIWKWPPPPLQLQLGQIRHLIRGISAVVRHLVMYSTTPWQGRAHKLKSFIMFLHVFEGFCIELKQKQKVVVFCNQKLWSDTNQSPPPPPPNHPKLPFFLCRPILLISAVWQIICRFVHWMFPCGQSGRHPVDNLSDIQRTTCESAKKLGRYEQVVDEGPIVLVLQEVVEGVDQIISDLQRTQIVTEIFWTTIATDK